MTKDLGQRKNRIIEEILKIDDEGVLSALEEQFEGIIPNAFLWRRVMKPMRKTLSVEEMVIEQNYEPMTENDFFKLAEKIEIEESLEELLAQLD